MLAGARGRAQEIIAQRPRSARRETIEAAKAQAKAEADRIVAGAKAEIAQEVARAKEQLRDQVAELAVAGAEKILQREVDAKAHAQMLAGLKSELEAERHGRDRDDRAAVRGGGVQGRATAKAGSPAWADDARPARCRSPRIPRSPSRSAIPNVDARTSSTV